MFLAICVPLNPGRCAAAPDEPAMPRPSIPPPFIGVRGAPVDAPLTRPAKGLLLATVGPWLNPPVARLNVGRIPERGGVAA